MVFALPIAVFVAATLARVLWLQQAAKRPLILPIAKKPMLTLKTLQSLRRKA